MNAAHHFDSFPRRSSLPHPARPSPPPSGGKAAAGPDERLPAPLRRTLTTVLALPLLAALCALTSLRLPAAEPAPASPGAQVAVVYNQRFPGSRALAEYYAARRAVPTNQLIGLDLPETETISRPEYLARLEKPLLARLESLGLLTFSPATNAAPDGRTVRRVLDARIRYIALCRGVPSRILRDPAFTEAHANSLPEPLRRNEASVDTQLALCPRAELNLPWAGYIRSPFYGATNAALLDPRNGLLMVTRLDGPSDAIARRLIDHALEAETNGLWGRAWFDARGLATNDSYFRGDALIRAAAEFTRRAGFETVLDNAPATFAAGEPLSQIAFYAGWYDQAVSGPFTRPTVEFLPGAFAYHLYSFNASTLRGTNSWAGRLLQLGATITVGSVDEPYLDGTPDIAVLIAFLVQRGFSFAEAAYAAEPSLSWQSTFVGDPLYRPFARSPDDLAADLQKRDPARLEWYYLMAVNQKLAAGAPPAEAIRALEDLPLARRSALLTEKLADLYWTRGSLNDAIDLAEAALRRNPSPAQRRRLLLIAAARRASVGPDDTALAHYETFLKENPDDPSRLNVYRLMLPLAQRRQRTNDITRIEAEIRRLAPADKPR